MTASLENKPDFNNSFDVLKKPDEETKKVEALILAGISKKEIFASRSIDNSQVAILSRAVMRQPVSEGREVLNRIHSQMRLRFAPLSDEALSWLLGGSSFNAQGGFKDVQALREFLDKDPSLIQSSRLINGIETILTAIGYRLIRAQYGVAPFAPETDEQKKIDAVLQEIKSGYFVPPINAVYLKRMEEGAAQFLPGQFSKTLCPQLEDPYLIGLPEEDLSDPSDDEEKAVKQPRRLQGRVLKTHSRWTRECLNQGVEARAHASGTAPLVLASALGLYQLDKSNYLEVDRIVSLLGGILVIPTFDRGDYHSVAEAYAGIHYYKHAILNGVSSDKDPILQSFEMQPRSALKKGLELMVRCLDPQHQKAAKQIIREYLRANAICMKTENSQFRESHRQKIVEQSPLFRNALLAMN